MEWWIPLDPAAWRYGLTGWAEGEVELKRWRPEHRYDGKGKHADSAAALTREARERVDGVVAALWMDGRLRDGAL